MSIADSYSPLSMVPSVLKESLNLNGDFSRFERVNLDQLKGFEEEIQNYVRTIEDKAHEVLKRPDNQTLDPFDPFKEIEPPVLEDDQKALLEVIDGMRMNTLKTYPKIGEKFIIFFKRYPERMIAGETILNEMQRGATARAITLVDLKPEEMHAAFPLKKAPLNSPWQDWIWYSVIFSTFTYVLGFISGWGFIGCRRSRRNQSQQKVETSQPLNNRPTISLQQVGSGVEYAELALERDPVEEVREFIEKEQREQQEQQGPNPQRSWFGKWRF